MEQSLADLLSDAFAETSVPSFPDGDLDFENLNFDEKFDEDKIGISHENLPTKEVALHQEATGDTVLSCKETLDTCMAENLDEELSDAKEDFHGAGVMSTDKIPEEDYTSSDGESEEGSASGEDEEDEEEDKGTGEKPGDLLMSVHCGDEFHDGNKEDRIFAEGQPLAPEGTENPQVRNEEQGESESDEEVSYFERVPERGGEVIIKGDGNEEDEQEGEEKKQDSSDSECEDMKIEQEEHFLAQCSEQEVENPYRDEPAKATLEFPEISVENLQDLIAEVDTEEDVEKMKDFSGEEHQEAGESFADYPSDFSSCEFVEDGDKNQENYRLNASPCASGLSSNAKQSTCLERAVTDVTWVGKAEDTDEEGDGYLYSRDLEMDADRFRGPGVASGEKIEYVERVMGDAVATGCDDESETSESDSYSSSSDEAQVRRSNEEFSDNMSLQDLQNNKQLEGTRLHSGSSAEFSRWSVSEDHHVTNYYDRPDSAAFNIRDLNVLNADSPLLQDLQTTEDTDRAETLSSDVTQCPAEDVNSYSAVQREGAKTTSPSNQGSLDDSFFFNTEPEASGISELGQLGDDEYEDDRNWEQEQERIKAFYRFYNDSDGDGENGREGRQIKVQFCTDPLSQVIHYETESDRDLLSSSTEGEEDLNSAETTEELREPDNTLQVEPACDPPNIQLPESAPDLSNTQICTRKHKCLNMLKLTLKMGLVILMGLLMFWLATDQADWLSQVHFF